MRRKIFIILLIIIVFYVYKSSNSEIIIPESAIRLRVIPNSNNVKDINIKEQVKRYLETDIYKMVGDTNDIDIARDIITNSIPSIEDNINYIFNENNYNVPFKVNFGENYFPEKNYKGIIYQEGYYESLVIEIGNGEGDNWWCVLFPNFCLIDMDNDYEYKLYIKEVLEKIF